MRTPTHPTGASGADPRIDAYVADLGAAVRGPRRARADLLAEARDGLTDAAEAYTTAGLAPADAARRAIAEFGAVADIAPAYEEELAAAQGRRTALGVLLTHLIVAAEGELSWRIFDLWHGRHPGPGYLFMADVANAANFVLLSALALVLLAYGRPGRFVPQRLLVRVTGVLAFVVLGFLLVGSTTLMMATPVASAGVLAAVLCLAPVLVPGGVTLAVAGRGARRCLVLAR